MNVLQLNDSGTKKALQHPALSGLSVIGRGKFSLVLDGGDRVYHLTTDHVSYAMHCDRSSKCAGVHFSRVLEDFGIVGHHKRNNIALYLFATEKLVPLKGWTTQRRNMKDLIMFYGWADTEWITNHSVEKYSSTGAQFKFHRMAEFTGSRDLISLTEALSKLAKFSEKFADAGADLHAANFMVRPATGELVFNDPVCDANLYARAYARLGAAA